MKIVIFTFLGILSQNKTKSFFFFCHVTWLSGMPDKHFSWRHTGNQQARGLIDINTQGWEAGFYEDKFTSICKCLRQRQGVVAGNLKKAGVMPLQPFLDFGLLPLPFTDFQLHMLTYPLTWQKLQVDRLQTNKSGLVCVTNTHNFGHINYEYMK